MHSEAADPEYVPAGHGVSDEAPLPFTKEPGVANEQDVDPGSAEYVPDRQGVHSLAPEPEYVPGWHTDWCAAPLALTRLPGAASEQEDVPSTDV